MSTVIKVENLSKQYRLGTIGTGTLSHDLNRWWYKIRGKEDPYLKISQLNDRTQKNGTNDYVWALKDISFEVERGELVGIIGRNGAGKSSLLKILSRITTPTSGSVKMKGRIASLLEVGTGFHPELTGRENIFLNGAILGMRRAEVKSKFEEIVAFAGIEKYVDTPVKRYSSGMYVRLAFAVAAHLESEILVVDEVLAVGDLEFQKKCLSKMGDISRGEGRTVLFVSHNIGSIRRLCNRGIFLQNGTVHSMGGIEEITDLYIKRNSNLTERFVEFPEIQKPVYFNSVALYVVGKPTGSVIDITDSIKISIEYHVRADIKGVNIALELSKDGFLIFRTWDVDNDNDLFTNRKKGTYTTEIILPKYLSVGTYSISVACGQSGVGVFTKHEDCISFDIENVKTDGAHKSFTRGGLINVAIKWHTSRQ